MTAADFTRFISMSALLCAGAAAWNDAHAGVEFCNQGATRLNLAFAYGAKDPAGVSTDDPPGMTAKGWWDLEPSECATVGTMDASQYWLYYYARSEGGVDDGNAMLCVASKPFTLAQQFRRKGEGCPGGQRLLGFRQFDADEKDWTINLR